MHLNQVAGWPVSVVAQLEKSWNTTVEQVVAAAATPNGIHSLAEHVGLTDEQMEDLVAKARNLLSAETLRRLEEPVDTSNYGLGARGPR